MVNNRRKRAELGRQWLRCCGLVAVLWALAAPVPRALADDDAPPRVIVVAPRAEARIGDQELVMTYLDATPGVPATGKLIVYLQRYVDGVPTPGAKIDVTVDFISETLTEIGPGVYSSASLPIAAGRNDVQVDYELGSQKGTASFPLIVTPTKGLTPILVLPPVTNRSVPGFVLAIFAVLIFAGVNVLLLRRARRARATGSAPPLSPGEVVDDDLPGQPEPQEVPRHADGKQSARHVQEHDAEVAGAV